MTIKSDAPISEERRAEIYRMCGGRARGVGPEYDDFLANPARIAAYVDAEIAKTVDFRDSGAALKMQARALEVVHKVQVKEAVRAALEELGDAVNDALIIGGVITVDKIVLMRQTIRALLAEKVGT